MVSFDCDLALTAILEIIEFYLFFVSFHIECFFLVCRGFDSLLFRFEYILRNVIEFYLVFTSFSMVFLGSNGVLWVLTEFAVVLIDFIARWVILLRFHRC